MGRGRQEQRWFGASARGIALAITLVVIAVGIVAIGGRHAGSEVTTSSLTPVADAFVDATTASTKYGTSTQLVTDASPKREVFIRFNLSGLTGPVQSATLRIHAADVTDAATPNGGTVAKVNNTTWSETAITYTNRPTSWATASFAVGAVVRNTWIAVPVTSVVTTGTTLTLGIRSTNTDGAYFDSRETGANAPQLVVVSGTPSSSSSSSSTSSSSTTSSSTTTSTSTTTTTTLPTTTGTETLVPMADAFVDATTPSTTYGTGAQIVVDGSPARETYLRFDLASVTGTVQSARLRLHVSNTTDGGSADGGSVARLENTGWTESAITYANRPTSWDTATVPMGAVTKNTWVEATVTSQVTTVLVNGSVLTLGIRSSNTDGAYYDSRETGANGPQLVVTTGTPSPPVTGVTVAAVGDMVCAPASMTTASQCRQQEVSSLLVSDPSIESFLALGDLQYENGELASFQTAYDPSYGRVKAKTRPAPGNHEYNTAGAPGYYTYFGAAAGDPTKGYYSFDVGAKWHVVVLNSNCSAVSCAAGSTQEQWLRSDLAASARPCTIATWHHPRFTSGASHSNDTSSAAFWTALQQYGAELVLNGHVHNYERFAPQLPTAAGSATGIQEIIVGTGGRSLDTFATVQPNSLVRLSSFGVLKLVLGDGAYSWQFVDESGTTRDSGTGTCH